jgi:hypothetical protein
MVELPTNAELRKLPIPAIVAYAVRCARRVQPLYSLARSTNVERYQGALENALGVGERFCQGHPVSAEAPSALRSVKRAMIRDHEAAHDVAVAVAACVEAAIAGASDDVEDTVACSDSTASYAAAAVLNAAAGDAATIYTAAMEDYTHLRDMYRRTWRGGRRRTETIDPSAEGPLGPYWPKGEPKWVHSVRDGGVADDEIAGRRSDD